MRRDLEELEVISAALGRLYSDAYVARYSSQKTGEVPGRSSAPPDPTYLAAEYGESLGRQLSSASRAVAHAVRSLRAADHTLALAVGLPSHMGGRGPGRNRRGHAALLREIRRG